LKKGCFFDLIKVGMGGVWGVGSTLPGCGEHGRAGHQPGDVNQMLLGFAKKYNL
jgi:hypothetical protein